MGVNIFVSHGSKYAEIANSLKRSLLRVKSTNPLSVMLSEDMPAGREWRKWIEENVRTADVFVLLYPHMSMDMGWCNYELGRFFKSADTSASDNVVTIRNTDIPKPPPVFEPYQSVQADPSGLMKFMKDLFVTGSLTNNEVLNKNVEKVLSDDGVLVSEIAQELAEKFAAVRVDEQLYERRLVISVKYNGAKQLDADNSVIEGNDSGMNLLGFHYMQGMKWSAVRNHLLASAEWPQELERAMTAMEAGQLPPPLSPFRCQSGIYIPVIVRTEIVDRVLRQVFVIFVPADSERLGPLFEGSSLPIGMPATVKSLVRLLRLLFRARWEILEPRWAEAGRKKPTKERCVEIAGVVLEDFELLNRDLVSMGLGTDDAFYEIFHRDIWDEIAAHGQEWLTIVGEMQANLPDNPEELVRLLTALRNNNAKWMNISARQFAQAVENCCLVKIGTN